MALNLPQVSYLTLEGTAKQCIGQQTAKKRAESKAMETIQISLVVVGPLTVLVAHNLTCKQSLPSSNGLLTQLESPPFQTKRRKTMQERLQEQHSSSLVIEDNNDDGGRRRTRSSLRGTPTSTEKSPVPAKRARNATVTTPTSAKKGRTPAKKNLVEMDDEEVRVD